MNYIIFGTVLLSIIFSFSLVGNTFAQSEVICHNCIDIRPYQLDLYKELLPLIIWTDDKVFDHESTITVNGFMRPQNTVAPIQVIVTNPIGNVVTIKQISPNFDGNFSFDLRTDSPLWTKNGDYIIKVQSGEGSQIFKTKITLVSSNISGKCNFSGEISLLISNGETYCLPYAISEGVIKSKLGNLNIEAKVMTLELVGEDVKSITFDIPRKILDAKSPTGNDSIFSVTANGKIVEYKEVKNDNISRKIKLDFPAGDRATFEIVGTHVIPEFGAGVLFVMIGSIISILVISRSLSHKMIKI